MGIAGNYIKKLVIDALNDKVKDQSNTNVPVRPQFMIFQGNQIPTFPCITLGLKGKLREDQIANEDRLYLSVWSKTGQSELWYIYKQVYDLLNLKSFPGTVDTDYHQIVLMRETFFDDNLYNEKTFTFQLASRYHIDYL